MYFENVVIDNQKLPLGVNQLDGLSLYNQLGFVTKAITFFWYYFLFSQKTLVVNIRILLKQANQIS